jgi:hypothetical protein
MRLLQSVPVLFFIGGCAHKISSLDPSTQREPVPHGAHVVVTEIDGHPYKCGHPLYVVIGTAGIIPAGCSRLYEAKITDPASGVVRTTSYKLTETMGWLTYLLLPLKSWRYGFIEDPHLEVERAVRKSTPQDRD